MMNKILFITTLLLSGLITLAQKENLGTKVNSTFSEIAPKISMDGNTLFFVRENHPENSTQNGDSQDAWMVKLENDSIISNAIHLKKSVNLSDFNAVLYESVDGQQRIIKGVFKKGVLVKSGFSVIYKNKDSWTSPKELKIKKFKKYDKGIYNDFAMSPSGNRIILALSPEKDDEFTSLYVSEKMMGNKWSEPVKIEKLTTGNDYGMFIASDNKTMYFSSFRKGGLGEADIYVTKRLDDTWLNWSEPVNLGTDVNTATSDANYQVSPSGKYAYLVSAKNSLGKSDVFRIALEEVEEEKKPDPVVIVNGKVFDAVTNEVITANLIYKDAVSHKIEGTAKSDANSGEFKLVLPYGKNYTLDASLPGYYSNSVVLDLTTIGEFETINKDIFLTKIEEESIIALNNIFFETGKSELLETSVNELQKLTALLKENKKMKVEIIGHTDNVGSSESNKVLSKNRANAVVQYLIKAGIDKKKLSSQGYGEKRPVETNATEEGRSKNRRVEFRVLSL